MFIILQIRFTTKQDYFKIISKLTLQRKVTATYFLLKATSSVLTSFCILKKKYYCKNINYSLDFASIYTDAPFELYSNSGTLVSLDINFMLTYGGVKA